mmetsp:Transcript_76333/g.210710  ORF Transcript_76333/g.210710 Transcript_76333/m.210710 type:complete len:206 (+) Transcript_76333:674-1291(+)
MDLARDGGQDDGPEDAHYEPPLHHLLWCVEERPAFGCQELQERQQRLGPADPGLAQHLEDADAGAIHHVGGEVKGQASGARGRAEGREQQQAEERPGAQGLGASGAPGHLPQRKGNRGEDRGGQHLQLEATLLIDAELALEALQNVLRVDLIVNAVDDSDSARGKSEVPEARPHTLVHVDRPVELPGQRAEGHREGGVVQHLLAR